MTGECGIRLVELRQLRDAVFEILLRHGLEDYTVVRHVMVNFS